VFKFNTAIAAMMQLVNEIYQRGADKEVFSKLLILLSPIAPHFCEELWHILGNAQSITKARWPEYDHSILVERKVTIVIQVNGKVRSKLEVESDIPEAELKNLVLADEKTRAWLKDPVKSVVVVPRKLVNIVV